MKKFIQLSIFTVIIITLIGFSSHDVYASNNFFGWIGNCISGTNCDTTNHVTTQFCNDCTVLGSFGSGNGQFARPYGIALNSTGDIYVVDDDNQRIEKFNSAGTYLSKFGSLGSGNGQFDSPIGLALDSSGYIYVVDNGNQRIEKFDSAGNFQGWIGDCISGTNCNTTNHVTTQFCSNCLALPTSYWPTTGNGQFNYPVGIALDSTGNIYVGDTNNNRVEKFNSAGNFQGWIGDCISGTNCNTTNHVTTQFCNDCTVLGSFGSGNGQFARPYGIALDSSGIIYVADTDNNRVEKFDSAGNFQGWIGNCISGTNCNTTNHVTTQFCSTCVLGSSGSGNGQFDFPVDVALDSTGNIDVVDSSNNRVEKFNSAGTYISQFGSSGSGNGQFAGPYGIALDSSGIIYVADTDNNRVEKLLSTNSSSTFLTKTANATNITVGQSVTFTYTESNTGTTSLQNISVTDNQCSPVQPIPLIGFNIGDLNHNGILDPGESWQFQCIHTFNTAGVFTNTAIGNGTTPNGTHISYPPYASERANATVTVTNATVPVSLCTHWDKIVFTINNSPHGKIPQNLTGTELDIKVKDDPTKVADIKGKVKSFLKNGVQVDPIGSIPQLSTNDLKTLKINIINVDYAIACEK